MLWDPVPKKIFGGFELSVAVYTCEDSGVAVEGHVIPDCAGIGVLGLVEPLATHMAQVWHFLLVHTSKKMKSLGREGKTNIQ